MEKRADIIGEDIPFGCTYREAEDAFYFCAAADCRSLSLKLYEEDGGEPGTGAEKDGTEDAKEHRTVKSKKSGMKEREMHQFADRWSTSSAAFVLHFPEENRQGNVFRMRLRLPADGKRYSYTYLADGVEFADPYGRRLECAAEWGMRRERPMRTLLPEAVYHKTADSGNFRQSEVRTESQTEPRIEPKIVSCSACGSGAVCRLHVRTFTKDASSGVEAEKHGTFDGVIEKLPYLRALGTDCLELLPVCEFEETLPEEMPGRTAAADENTEKRRQGAHVNLWGFTPHAMRFSVKQAYGGRDGFARLLRAVHEQGMTLFADLYFDGTEPFSYVLDVVKTWLFEYGADGLNLVGSVPIDLLLKEPCLKGARLWYHSGRPDALYRTDFQNDMRRFLKGDAGMLAAAARHLCGFQDGAAVPPAPEKLHFMANTDGFTLWDVFSYDRKHNEANGEQNEDGTDQNFSWNCGEEGPSRKKKVRELREQLYKNAVLMTFFSAGTPLFLAGDEFGHSKQGNNNSWCQDNAVEWLNWKHTAEEEKLLGFFRKVTALRREHPVLCRRTPPRFRDWKSLGLPDVSLHGTEAWRPDFSQDSRQLGILYYGAYEKKENGDCDDSFYIGYNMYWEPQEFALPKIPGGGKWKLLIDTAEREIYGKRKAGNQKAEKLTSGKPEAGKLEIRKPGTGKGMVPETEDALAGTAFQAAVLENQSRVRIEGRAAVVLIAETTGR